MDDAYRRGGGGVNPAPAVDPCLFPVLREKGVRRCFAGENDRRRRRRERGRDAVRCKEAGRRKARTRIQSGCVQVECVKPQNHKTPVSLLQRYPCLSTDTQITINVRKRDEKATWMHVVSTAASFVWIMLSTVQQENAKPHAAWIWAAWLQNKRVWVLNWPVATCHSLKTCGTLWKVKCVKEIGNSFIGQLRAHKQGNWLLINEHKLLLNKKYQKVKYEIERM